MLKTWCRQVPVDVQNDMLLTSIFYVDEIACKNTVVVDNMDYDQVHLDTIDLHWSTLLDLETLLRKLARLQKEINLDNLLITQGQVPLVCIERREYRAKPQRATLDLCRWRRHMRHYVERQKRQRGMVLLFLLYLFAQWVLILTQLE